MNNKQIRIYLNEIKNKNHGEIIYLILERTGVSVNGLCKKIDMAYSIVHRRLNKYGDIYLRNFVQMVDALGYEVVVRPKDGHDDEIVVGW